MTIAITPDYRGDIRDRLENYRGDQLLFVGWQDHNMFCSPVCIKVCADWPFCTLIEQSLPAIYGTHPDWANIRWQQVEWHRSGMPFMPDINKTLAENGLDHKAVIVMTTPGLDGIGHSFS